jgi:hypothetical protein
MRKLKIIEHISLDGVIQVSGDDDDFLYGDWTAPYRTPAGRDEIIAAHGGRYDLLCARNPATLIRARQHESNAVRHHLHCMQGRRVFEDGIVDDATSSAKIARSCCIHSRSDRNFGTVRSVTILTRCMWASEQ